MNLRNRIFEVVDLAVYGSPFMRDLVRLSKLQSSRAEERPFLRIYLLTERQTAKWRRRRYWMDSYLPYKQYNFRSSLACGLSSIYGLVQYIVIHFAMAKLLLQRLRPVHRQYYLSYMLFIKSIQTVINLFYYKGIWDSYTFIML